MYKQGLTRLSVFFSLGLLTALPWSCTSDHRVPDNCAQLLTGCTSGWVPGYVYNQGTSLGPATRSCYRLIFRSDGTSAYDRTRCTDEPTSLLEGGPWSCTPSSITLRPRPYNMFGPPTGGRLDLLTTTELKFSFRGDGPDKITESWTCE